ncbi:MAG: mechanosensitive ion channel family protein [Candidatus Pacebacteria bacterium]|nr:mechanosensitive ion channel family protein [Candidatus Paceibacterota bacterium]
MVLFSFEQFIIWFFEKGIKIILILVFAFVLTQVFKILISRFLRHFLKKKDKLEKVKLKLEEERIKTLHNVLYSIAKTIIWIFAVITVLPEVGINITPLLTGLGIGGLALGFGAKNLIQDYISGLFILIEDQFRAGEEVEIGGKKGKIVDFNLRRTILKDKDGILHFIPNSQIKVATNFSRKLDR